MIRSHTHRPDTSLRFEPLHILTGMFGCGIDPRSPKHWPGVNARRASTGTPRLIRRDERSHITEKRNGT